MFETKEVKIPGDKSISHRAIMLSALAQGKTVIENILVSEDLERTIDCFRAMGVKIELDRENNIAVVYGVGVNGLKKPEKELYCGNSGTTMRLIAGILVGQKFDSILTGDESLSSRPMKRIIDPLSKMGGKIYSKTDDQRPPLYVDGNQKLIPITYNMEVSSAQVKSAILLADIFTDGKSKVIEKTITRNHTENMIEYFNGNNWCVDKIIIPGDISSAAYFIVYGLLTDKYEIIIKNVGINPTRMGLVDILKNIGGNIDIRNMHFICNEKVGDIYVKQSVLKPFVLGKDIMGRLIDEIPILAVLACFIDGESEIKEAEELRVKETDRINAICRNLELLQVPVVETKDGFIITGGKTFNHSKLKSYGDHRIAMAFAVMNKIIGNNNEISNSDAVNISFPSFFKELAN